MLQKLGEFRTNHVKERKMLGVRNIFCTQWTEYEIKVIYLYRIDYLYKRVSAIFQTRFPLQFFKDSAIGIVDLVGLYGGKIDARGFLVVVPHTLRNNRKRHIFRLGNARPTVTADIHSQRRGNLRQLSDLFQFSIDKQNLIEVLFAFCAVLFSDDRQQILRRILGVFVDNLLHRPLPANRKLLPGLFADIGNIAVRQIAFAQQLP